MYRVQRRSGPASARSHRESRRGLRPHAPRTAPIPAGELSGLAEAYGTEPLLLYEFLFPSLRPVIAVRRDVDYREVPASYPGSARSVYRVPCRRLADSDLGVAHLALPPVDRHPGHELIIPLRGRVRLGIAGLHTDVSAADHVFSHYSSEAEHQVVNGSREPAEMLVARFYE